MELELYMRILSAAGICILPWIASVLAAREACRYTLGVRRFHEGWSECDLDLGLSSGLGLVLKRQVSSVPSSAASSRYPSSRSGREQWGIVRWLHPPSIPRWTPCL